MSASTTWQPHDYGRALLEAARASGERLHPEGGGRFRCRAWWRGGDGLSVSIDSNEGVLRDYAHKQHASARAIAERMGMSLPDFMRRFGVGGVAANTDVRQAPRQLKADRWLPLDAWQTWERTAEAQLYPEATQPNPARQWLADVRGIPLDARVESGLATADASLFPETDLDETAGKPFPAREWAAWKMRKAGCPAALAPIRNAESSRVEALALRFLEKPKDPTVDKVLIPLGLHKSAADGTPRGYGWAGASLKAPLLVLCEGLVDTLVAEACLHGDLDAAAVGAIDHGEMKRAWPDFLRRRQGGRVVVVPHLDRVPGEPDNAPPHMDGVGQKAALDVVAGVHGGERSARLFRWGVFHGLLEDVGVEHAALRVRDLGDAVRAMTDIGMPFGVLREILLSAVEVSA